MSGIRSIPPLKDVADHLATKGRYGDTMLVHMNPVEVKALGSLVPGGELTINPDTGQPEAFLPFLLPVLGGLAGSFAGPALGMSAVMGGALGAGLGGFGGGMASGKDVGSSLGQGIMSGLLSYGLGSAVDLFAGAGAEGATAALASPAAQAAPAVAPMAGSDAAIQGIEAAKAQALNAAPGAVPATPAPSPVPQIPNFNGVSNTPGLPNGMAGVDPSRMGWNGDPTAMAPLSGPDLMGNKLQLAGEGLSPKSMWDVFGKNAMKTTVPIGLGAMGMMDSMNQPQGGMAPPPPPMGIRTPYNGPNPIHRRGARTPPPAGYRPGTDPEWNYFGGGFKDGGRVEEELYRDSWIDPSGQYRALQERQLETKTAPRMSLEEYEELLMESEAARGPYGDLRSSNPFKPSRQRTSSFSEGGRVAEGPGDGISDGIPALINGNVPSALSDGEYVIPAHAVSALGNGSTKAGIRALDGMVDQIMEHKYGTKDRTPNPF